MIVRTWVDGGRSPAQSPTSEPGVSEPRLAGGQGRLLSDAVLDDPCRRPRPLT
jgi:hypothetical protein